LIGSTGGAVLFLSKIPADICLIEWGEDFADWVDEHVVAYLNLGRSFIVMVRQDLLI
jgi:hypothetical protein